MAYAMNAIFVCHLLFACTVSLFIISICSKAVICAPLSNNTHGVSNAQKENIGFSNQTRFVINPETDAFEGGDLREGDFLEEHYRNARRNRKWPEGGGNVSIPYVITEAVEYKKKDILAAMDMISAKSCIKFHEREKEDNYLFFRPGRGCASYVGCIGGKQPLLIASKCRVGNICHELLHALGFFHEHSRLDRDDYIKIQLKNVIKGKEKNFKKVKGDTLKLPYDLRSILHYGDSFFSANGKPTIVSREEGVKIGQRSYLSKIDVQRLQRFYNCGLQEKNEE